MLDCANDITAYHNQKVTLPQEDRTAMRDRRNANRDRLKDGLDEKSDPQPFAFHKQGSYAMLTMVQHDDNAYDIDDGVYFNKEDLVGNRGAEMSALDARKMVRDAVDDGSFKTAPEVRENCVRVLYAAGYHVDMPVYRKRIEKKLWGPDEEIFEIAGSDWKRSDARLVTDWFNRENTNQSPDTDNGRQLRRITRLIKKYAQSRASWKGLIASGFAITKLVTECYRKDAQREDCALRNTMQAIKNRLDGSLVVKHPTTPDETISKGNDDPKLRFLREKLEEALGKLSVLDSSDCTRDEALKAWDKVFSTDFFAKRANSAKAACSGPAILTSGIIGSISANAEQVPVRKEGGGRFA
jgi:hypothetical protein